jgi:hypothetical protein
MAIARIGTNWIDWLEEFLQIDINGDGYIGGKKPPVSPVLDSTDIGQKKPVVIRGFEWPEIKPVPPVSEQLSEQSQNVVPQPIIPPPEVPVPPVSEQPETPVSEGKEKVIITRIVETSTADIRKWKKYAKHYYKQSLASVTDAAKLRNRKTYLKNRELLEISGKYKFTEGPEKLVIEEV